MAVDRYSRKMRETEELHEVRRPYGGPPRQANAVSSFFFRRAQGCKRDVEKQRACHSYEAETSDVAPPPRLSDRRVGSSKFPPGSQGHPQSICIPPSRIVARSSHRSVKRGARHAAHTSLPNCGYPHADVSYGKRASGFGTKSSSERLAVDQPGSAASPVFTSARRRRLFFLPGAFALIIAMFSVHQSSVSRDSSALSAVFPWSSGLPSALSSPPVSTLGAMAYTLSSDSYNDVFLDLSDGLTRPRETLTVRLRKGRTLNITGFDRSRFEISPANFKQEAYQVRSNLPMVCVTSQLVRLAGFFVFAAPLTDFWAIETPPGAKHPTYIFSWPAGGQHVTLRGGVCVQLHDHKNPNNSIFIIIRPSSSVASKPAFALVAATVLVAVIRSVW
ncbi:putative transmembrane protein [Toxoplasma gondii p89]|uniref:Putative transmembrane protein n=2 Tax=Toxoplasma gondii TaxID=5811 RepID=A0A2T6IFB3_TOXGO|nr:putative transmembrane protein [Toxoplasma gondii p89]PUA84030.1 putative transmembrane protein [Toxoplasma gondii TgCATBr9]